MSIKGLLVDDQSRCEHWKSPLDIVALRFRCCDEFYACYSCHQECTNHGVKRYSLKDAKSTTLVICGVCRLQMTFEQYHQLNCPRCHSPFNPGCKLHYHLYFEP